MARRVVTEDEFTRAVFLLHQWFRHKFFIQYYLKPGGLGDSTLISGRIVGHIIKRDGERGKWEPWYFDEIELMATLNAAYFKKDPLADKVARSLFYHAHSSKIDVPQSLAEFTDYALQKKPIKAATTKNLDIMMRNDLIVTAIKWLKTNSSLAHTRNDATNAAHSCCDAIAAVFHGQNNSLSLTYESIKAIWAKREGITFQPSILWGTLPG